MQPTLLALALVSVVGTLNVDAAGGVSLQGAGFGVLQTNDGQFTCPNSPVLVHVLYTPDGHGVLTTTTVASCLGIVGITFVCCQVAVDTTQNPPYQVTFFCAGTEATGLSCSAVVNGVPVTAIVGPSAGPGSTVTLGVTGAYVFNGVFTGV